MLCWHQIKKRIIPMNKLLSAIAVTVATSALATPLSASADVCQHEIAPTNAYKEAVLFYPCDLDGALPAVTLTGGYSNTYRNLQWLAEDMAEAGYVVLAMTPPNIYGKVEQWRDAHLEGQKTLVAVAEDNDTPVAKHIDTDRRGIAGFSMGGGGTLLAGSILKDDVKALAAFAPFLLEEQRNVSPTAPTLVIAGEKDLLITNESITQIYDHVQASANKNMIAIYADGRHQQWYRAEVTKNRESYTELALAWLNLHLKNEPSAQTTLKAPTPPAEDTFSRLEAHL